MRRVFADTHFYVALLNRDDPAHPKAREWEALTNDGHFGQAGFTALLVEK